MAESTRLGDVHQSVIKPWRGADCENRSSSWRGEAAAQRPTAPTRLDRCTLDNQRTLAGPGWHTQKTEVDDYAEWVLIEDIDESLCTRLNSPRHASPPHHTNLADDIESNAELSLSVGPLTQVEKLAAAARRSKRNLKWKVLMLRADRLWTLTTRGGIPSRDEAWRLWGHFERYCSKRFKNFKTVVVMELHCGDGANVGNWHIHFVTNRFFDVNSMRFWWHRILYS